MREETKKPPHSKPRLLQSAEESAKICLALICIATFAPFLGTMHWLIELGSHFVHCYFWSALLATTLLAIMRNRRWTIIGLVCVLINAALLIPCYIPIDAPDVKPNLRILHANILTSNTNYQAFLDLVRDVDPDIISVQENNAAWQHALRALDETYPYSKVVSRSDNFGIALYSRLPVHQLEAFDIADLGVPAIRTKITVAGQSLALLSVHTLPPLSGKHAQARATQFAAIPEILGKLGKPAILIGDLNTTMWSPHYRNLENATGLHNTRHGFGLGTTWPARYGPFGLPLDHILVSPSIKVLSFRVAPNIGSDHRPIIVDLYVPPSKEEG